MVFLLLLVVPSCFASSPSSTASKARQGKAGQGAALWCLLPPHLKILVPLPSSPETIAALFKSNLKIDFPFDLPETFFFVILG